MSQQKEETPIPPLSTKSSQIEQVDQVAEQAPVVECVKPVDSTSEEVFLNLFKTDHCSLQLRSSISSLNPTMKLSK